MMATPLNPEYVSPKVLDRVYLDGDTRMDCRVGYSELVAYFVARLVCRFVDHGETLENSAAFATFWCHRIAEECSPGFEVHIRDGAFDVDALLLVTSEQAKTAYLRCGRQYSCGATT